MTVLVSLVGEQPIPNLLAVKAVQPDCLLLVYSGLTASVADRMKKLPDMPCAVDCPVPAFDFPAIRDELERKIAVRGWSPNQLLFNLTGGTKAMALAAYEVAKAKGAPFLYLQSEGKRSILYRYRWELVDGELLPTQEGNREVSGLIKLDHYIRAYVGDWWHDDRDRGNPEGHRFEARVRDALWPDQGVVDELEANVRWSEAMEADLVLRAGGAFAVAEVKQGKHSGKKDDLQQLAMIARQQVFGTYIQPLFILGKEMDLNNRDLAESFGIEVIELPSWEASQDLPLDQRDLSADDRLTLQKRVREALAGEGEPG